MNKAKGHKYKSSDFYEDDNNVSEKPKYIIKNFKKYDNQLTKTAKFVTFSRTDDNVREQK